MELSVTAGKLQTVHRSDLKSVAGNHPKSLNECADVLLRTADTNREPD